jgi:hypothetical protein
MKLGAVEYAFCNNRNEFPQFCFKNQSPIGKYETLFPVCDLEISTRETLRSQEYLGSVYQFYLPPG